MTNLELDEYWNSNCTNFPDYEGWAPLIKEMLKELFENGLKPNAVIAAKEKYGKFKFLSITENLDNSVLEQIAHKYSELIGNSCMVCGNKAETVDIFGWDHTLCKLHFVDTYPKIENIDQEGFDFREEKIRWNAVFGIRYLEDYNTEITSSLDKLNKIELCLKEPCQDLGLWSGDNFSVSSEWLNWYSFLKSIPSHLAHKELSNSLETFYNSLTPCPRCGYIAVNNDRCLYCFFNQEHFNYRIEKYNKNGEDCLKNEQLFWYANTYTQALKALDTSFEKSEGYKILFTDSELSDLISDLQKG